MKELKAEAKRQHDEKLHKFCGGATHKRAHGGKVEEHPHEKKDKHLAKEIKHEAEEIEHDHEGKRHGGHVRHHRDMGGPIAGEGGGSKLGRARHKGGKGKTQVNIAIGKPGGDAGPGGPGGLPPALGAGPGPMPMPPRINPAPPVVPPAALAGAGPRPGMPPMKRGGAAHHKKEHERHEHKHEPKRHEHHHGHKGH